MNNTLTIETPIHTSTLGRRIRATIAASAPTRRRELTREELAQLREQHLLAERVVDDNRRFVYAARLM